MDFTEVQDLINGNDSKKKLEVILDKEKFLEIHPLERPKLIKSLDDESKYSLLHNKEFIRILYKEYHFSEFKVNDIFETLNDEYTYKLLCDKEYVEKVWQMEDFRIAEGIKRIESIENKKKLIEMYKENILVYMTDIITTFDDKTKLDYLLNNIEKFKEKMDIVDVLASVEDITMLMRFFKENKEFLTKNNIHPYEVTRNLKSDEKQEEVIAQLEEANLTSKEEKEIIVTMSEEIKQKEDMFPEEYKYLLDIHLTNLYYREYVIMPDLTKEIGIYQDLDNIIIVDPENYSEEEKRWKLMQLCKMCPNLKVLCNSFEERLYLATGEDYIQAETWIISVLDKLEKENYTDLQKLAIIDNAIGRKISYSPDFETEIFDEYASRKIWQIISSGYGVCLGIADAERYILNRVGIKSKIVEGKDHAFLLLENLKAQTPNGSTRVMNTIIDPTWNLSSHKFGERPNNFCVSYKEIREHDIDADGVDYECHKNDEKLTIATSSLNEEELREVFKSIGLTREDGNFPINDWIMESDKITEMYKENLEQYFTEQFLCFEKFYPQFTECQNESMKVISDIILGNQEIQFDKVVMDRVYEKKDTSKRPFFYIYVQADEFGEKFYIADKEEGKIMELSRDKFNERFECYDYDLNKNHGIRPWNEEKKVKMAEGGDKNIDSEDSDGR